MKFSGTVCGIKNGSKYYRADVHFTNKGIAHKRHLCADISSAVLEDKTYIAYDRIMAWGYDGKSPDLLSVSLLFMVIGRFRNLGSMYGHVTARYYDEDKGIYTKHPQYKLRGRPRTIKLYRLFTQQVVSKLPDNWEMATDEIKAWIKNHKKLPACVRSNHGTKRDKVHRDYRKAG